MWILGSLLVVLIVAIVGLHYVTSVANPILRERVIETLSARFKTRVELADLDVWVSSGLNVSGKGLKIFGSGDPNPAEPGIQPLIAVEEFSFRTGVLGLLHSPMRVDTVKVSGMVLNIPPHGRSGIPESDTQAQTTSLRAAEAKKSISQKHPWLKSNWVVDRWKQQKISIDVDHFVCDDTHLIINTDKPGKAPLDFNIKHLVMDEVGAGQPLRFAATLINPKPQGDIQSSGTFGPFHEDEPGDTPVAGDYTFTHADLSTLKGIAGILSSTGNYRGTLQKIDVQGTTETLDFRLDSAEHTVDLHTDFHALVDGMDGDTYLDPVKAHFLHTWLTAKGKVVRMQNPHGHDLELDLVVDRGRIEDLLELGVKTKPPVLKGNIRLDARMNVPPGPLKVIDRLQLDGTFHIPDGEFSNEKLQTRIDSLSLRSQGKAKQAQEHIDERVTSDLQGSFRLEQGMLSFSRLNFSVPGTHADVTGQYSLDGETFDFHGKLKMEAKLSQMTTGWKSFLLKAVDPFFHKDGAGTEIPFKVMGTRSEPHFGLDLHHSDTKPASKSDQTARTR